jgi:hypothetical protein
MGLPAEDVQKTATVKLVHKGTPCQLHPESVSIFRDSNSARLYCEVCIQQLEAALKTQQLQAEDQAKEAEEGGDAKNAITEPAYKTKDEEVRQLQNSLKTNIQNLAEKLAIKERELKASLQECSQFESLIGEKYTLIFEAIKETLEGKKGDYMSYLNRELSKNQERVELEKEVSHKLIKNFLEIKPNLVEELRKQKGIIERKEEQNQRILKKQEAREQRRQQAQADGKQEGEDSEEEDEEDEEDLEIDTSKIQAINTITEHFENILTKNFCAYRDYADFSFIEQRSTEQMEEAFKAFEQNSFKGEFQTKNWFNRGVLPRIYQAVEGSTILNTHKLLSNNKNLLFFKNKFSLPQKVAQICTSEGSYYFNGGYIPALKMYISNNFFFDEYRETMVNRQPMIHPRASHMAVMVNGFMYTLGGISDEKQVGVVGQQSLNCLKTVERYNFQQDKWTELAQMNFRRCQAGVCSFNDKYIFVFGGKNLVKGRHYEFVKEVEIYEINSNVWKTMPYVQSSKLNLLQPGAQQVTSNKIIVFGGLSPVEDNDDEAPGQIDEDKEKKVLKEDGIRLEVSSKVIEVDVSNGDIEDKEEMPQGQFYFPGTYSFIHSKKLYCLGFGASDKAQFSSQNKYDTKFTAVSSLVDLSWETLQDGLLNNSRKLS